MEIGWRYNYRACDIDDALVDICSPSCVWHIAADSFDWGDNVEEYEDDDAKKMTHQHHLDISAIDAIEH